jgi:hypothetical protein
MIIPDPIEIMKQRQEESMDRIVIINDVECYPCDDCGKATPLDDIVCMDPLGVSGGIYGDCLDRWIEEREKNETG